MLTRLFFWGLSSLYATSVLGSIEHDATSVFVSALVGHDGASAFECWKVQPPFSISAQPGTVGAQIQEIGDSKGGSIIFFNQSVETHSGLHPAPAPQ